MPKHKTHKGLKKRVKITGSGKVKRKRAFGQHLMSSRDAKRRRRIRSSALVIGKQADTIKRELGC
jgi:large subunit ribosomal protein L35